MENKRNAIAERNLRPRGPSVKENVPKVSKTVSKTIASGRNGRSIERRVLIPSMLTKSLRI
jgi:hypothetical protein